MSTSGNLVVSVYDTKPYDREYLSAAAGCNWFRLELETASTAKGDVDGKIR